MSKFDVYSMTEELDESLLNVMATRLEVRGSHPFFVKTMSDYLEAMDIDRFESVLDLGCGTGLVAREIAKRKSYTGKVLGVDLSNHLIDMAIQFRESEGIGERLDFQVGDSRNLTHPDAKFDAVIAHTLISHVDDPLAVINESSRLVKPGGLICIFDGDYASLAFSHENPAKAKEIDDTIQQAIVTGPTVMRQMPHLLHQADLEIVDSFSYVMADIGKADFWMSALESFRKLIPNSGVMTTKETNEWVDARIKESNNNTFFGASNFYTFIAKRR